MEKTLVLLKPDCVQRRLVGTLIERFEKKGLRLVGLKILLPSQELVAEHYAIHKERPFYPSLLKFLTSGPTVAVVLEGRKAIAVVRDMIGKTDAAEAAPGTIRGDFSLSKQNNLVHASDSAESAAVEIALWFKQEELLHYDPVDHVWVHG
jgi:nucleoside-diphosphate kinase